MIDVCCLRKAAGVGCGFEVKVSVIDSLPVVPVQVTIQVLYQSIDIRVQVRYRRITGTPIVAT